MNAIKIRTNRDIVVGQFYVSLASHGNYYVGIQFGNTKRLVCVVLNKQDAADNDPFFPDETAMYQDWEMTPCDQSEVFKNI